MYLIINWSQKRRDTGLASISLLHTAVFSVVIYATQTAVYQTVPSLGVPLSAPSHGLLLKVLHQKMVPEHHRARIISFLTQWSIQISFQNTA